MEPIIWIWLGILVFFLIIELATTSLTTIWFAGGALVALILAVVDAPLWAQIAAFIVVSILLLIFTRPALKRIMKPGTTKTNAEGLIGLEARVTSEINNMQATGTAVINGQEWTARSDNDSVILTEGQTAVIKGIEGVKLILTGKGE